MFNVVEVTDTYNRRGGIAHSERRVIFSTDNPVEMLKRCYEIDPAQGYNVTKPTVNMKKHIHVTREFNGKYIDFAEIFRIVEGDEKFNRIMNDDNACVFEKEWVASKN